MVKAIVFVINVIQMFRREHIVFFSIIIKNDYTVIIETMVVYFNLSLWALLRNVFYWSFKNIWDEELILIHKNELWNCETLLQSEKAL